ncbi:unnamed protein product [Rotaria sp. Silwood1]|nr:unnamed protein product [Rotaria sp. Silwood1]
MAGSSVIDDEESSYDDLTNFTTDITEEVTTNYHETSFLSPFTTNMSSPLSFESVYRSYQTDTQSYDNTPLESLIDCNQSDLVNLDNFSYDINTEDQQTINDNSDVVPPTCVIRTRPPPPPARLSPKIIEKILPPPPRPPRRMIVERFQECPPKPADVIIERWLPYKRTDRRQIFYQRAPQTNTQAREPNILILHEKPQARIKKEFINEGVVKVDPQSYIQRYGAELDSPQAKSQFASLIGEATRVLPPPQPTVSPAGQHSLPQSPTSYPHGYQSSPSASVLNVWDKIKSSSPISHPGSYPADEYSKFDSSYRYSPQFPDRTQEGGMKSMVDVTSLWSQQYNLPQSDTHLSSYQYSSPSSSLPTKTIQVNSDDELQHVLSDLTHGQVPTPFRSY